VCEGERGSGLGLTKRANWAHARIRPNGQDLWWFQAKGGASPIRRPQRRLLEHLFAYYGLNPYMVVRFIR
jgi:hypothetical protein